MCPLYSSYFSFSGIDGISKAQDLVRDFLLAFHKLSYPRKDPSGFFCYLNSYFSFYCEIKPVGTTKGGLKGRETIRRGIAHSQSQIPRLK